MPTRLPQPAPRDLASLRADTLAGLTGALVVLPQGMAFAAVAGLPLQFGLYAAMVPCVVAALLGSSRLMVTGPANAISLTLLALLSPLAAPGSGEYVQLAITLTALVGLSQLILGMARIGGLISRVPDCVIHGFTAGAALLILANQLPAAFGLDRAAATTVSANLHHLLLRAGSDSVVPAAVAGSTLAAIVIARTSGLGSAALLIGLLAGAIVEQGAERLLNYVPIAPRASSIFPVLPPLTIPMLDAGVVAKLAPAALVMTLLAIAEAVAIGRAVAQKNAQPFDGNREIIAQGAANFIGAFFSSYPTSGSFNRSSVNVEAGARTAWAAVLASIFVVAILAAFADLVAYLPAAAISGVLFHVGWKLLDPPGLMAILRNDASSRVPLLVTLVATLQLPLEIALAAGIGYVVIRASWRSLNRQGAAGKGHRNDSGSN